MEFKVREVTAEEKSVSEKEQELLDKHEQELNGDQGDVDDNVVDKVDDNTTSDNVDIDEPAELKEEDVLSYIGKRYNREINSFDELMAAREDNEDLPEDVAAFLKYKKETGRGIQDFLKIQEDLDEMNPDEMLKQYFLATEEGLDEDDIEAMMEDFSYDEDLDDESDVKKAKLAKKKALVKAKTYFTEQKEKYKQPLESRTVGIPEEDKEAYEAYKQYIQQANTLQEEQERKREWFQQKTDEVFGKEFKGFEFDVNDQKLVFAPGDATELKKVQSSPMNFINKYLDENGMMKDAVGYHKSLAIAMNPEKFAKFFYEQGLAAATDDVTRKIKNVNMSERKAPEVTNKGGVQIREVSPSSGRGLKIKSAKRI
jgi:hypothetical protein